MSRIIFKIFLFLLPLSLTWLFPAFVFITAREYYSAEHVVEVQLSHPEALCRMRYSDLGSPYKTLLTRARPTKIVSVGASRVLQIRQAFFTHPEEFTNAGEGGASIFEFESFIHDLLQERKVDLIILALDPEKFNPSLKVVDAESKNPSGLLARYKIFFGTNWRNVYQDFALGKVSYRALRASAGSHDIGVSAMTTHDGYRSDGSYQYGKVISDPNRLAVLETNIASTVTTIEHDRAFLYGASISEPALASLNRMLADAKSHNVAVIGFLPPLSKPVYAELMRIDDREKAMVKELPAKLAQTFSAYGFAWYDFSDVRVIPSAGDTEFIDSTHATDKLTLRLLIAIAEQNPTLRVRLDLPKLKNMLSASQQDFLNISLDTL